MISITSLINFAHILFNGPAMNGTIAHVYSYNIGNIIQNVASLPSLIWAMAPLQEFRLIELESSSNFTHQMTLAKKN
jgi:hypothetical protein